MLIIFIIIGLILYRNFSNKKENYVGNLKVASELDKKRAVKYALERLCKKKGYRWIQGGDEFVYDCKHTKETCEQESVYPTPKDEPLRYYEWRNNKNEEFFETGEGLVEYGTGRLLSASVGVGQSSDFSRKEDITRSDGVCILGNENFRNFCEKEDLRYDKSDGKCYTTQPYCNKRLLAFCNEDCFEPPGSMVLTKVFGTTIGRSIGMALPDAAGTFAVCQSQSKK
jgi:hypothetical protein